MIDFRWIAAIAVYTLLIGPVVGVPSGSASRDVAPKAVKAKTTAVIHSPTRERGF